MKTFLALASTLTLAACVSPPPDDGDAIASSLEQANGGLTMADEAPMFGDASAFDDAQLESSAAYSDPYASEVYATPPAITHVMIVWGQLPPDLANDEHAVDWSGSIAVSRGGLIVRRTIGFEPATDQILRRTDRMIVAFTSITKPFADGLVLDVVDPDPGAADPLTLTYARHDGTTHTIALADLLGGPVVRTVDDQGDKVIAMAERRDDTCDHGFGRGRWHAVQDGRGGLLGVISNADGDPIGHIRGIWGVRANGDHDFFGKYIDNDGRFRGVFAGHYAGGEMRGRWIDRSGEVGRLQGRYDASSPGPDVGGHFMLRWAESSCAMDIPGDGV